MIWSSWLSNTQTSVYRMNDLFFHFLLGEPFCRPLSVWRIRLENNRRSLCWGFPIYPIILNSCQRDMFPICRDSSSVEWGSWLVLYAGWSPSIWTGFSLRPSPFTLLTSTSLALNHTALPLSSWSSTSSLLRWHWRSRSNEYVDFCLFLLMILP